MKNSKGNYRNVVITGATSPLAIEFVKWANSKSFNVIAISRRSSPELENLIKLQTDNKLIIVDLGNTEDIKKAIDQIKKECNHIDLHINNACGWHEGGLQLTPFDEIQKQIDSSITGNILITQMIIPLLLRSPHPQIVNICSTVGTGYRFSPNTLYTVLKGALEAFGRSLRNDLRDENIRVTNIHLGQLEDYEPADILRIPLSDVVKVLELIVSVSLNSSVDNICVTPSKYYY